MKTKITEEVSETGFPYQVIQVPNLLRLKTGPLSINSPNEAVAAAAVASLCERQAGYVDELVGTALAEWSKATSMPQPVLDPVRVVLHELRGVSANFGYPMLEHIAAEAARLLERKVLGARAMAVVDAHIRSLAVVIAQKAVGDGGAIGRELRVSLAGARATLLP
jgi:hypothetical protein